MKKMIIIFLSVFIAFSPLLTIGNFCFAESGGGGAGGDAWIAVTDEASMVAAFKAYCRTRNFNKTFSYSNGLASDLAKAIITYDYNDLKNLCALAGQDIDTINAGIWYRIDQNNILKFFYNSSAMNILNQLYSALLTEHNIQENDQKQLYSGTYYRDLDGNSCYVYYFNSLSNSSTNANISKYGTIYRYTGQQLFANKLASLTSNLSNNTSITSNFTYTDTSTTKKVQTTYNNNTYTIYYDVKSGNENYTSKESGLVIGRVGNNFYYGYINIQYHKNPYVENTTYNYFNLLHIDNGSTNDVSVTGNQGDFNTPPQNKSMEVNTDSDTINNYITNNNSNVTNNYYDDDDPPEPPSYTNPYDDNPTGGTIDGNGNINFQMPDLNIDWNLNLNASDLPFPFSIPFDIIRFLTILDTEPEAPKYEIQTSILNNPIDFDIDLSVFDDGMEIIRNIILVGYILFLIISTRALFHIY